MDSGSGLNPDTGNKSKRSGGNGERMLGVFLKRIKPFLPKKDLNPRDLRSWATKTGFVSDHSGETSTSTRSKFGESSDFGLQKGRDQIVLDPVLGRNRPKRESEIEHVTAAEPGSGSGSREEQKRLNRNEATSETENEGGEINKDLENGFYYPGGGESLEEGEWPKPITVMKFGLRDNPGFVPLIYYGMQQYLSLAGSLVFIPLVIVPAMDGSDKDTAAVISTMLLLTGVSTILHSYFGTRLPLVRDNSRFRWSHVPSS